MKYHYTIVRRGTDPAILWKSMDDRDKTKEQLIGEIRKLRKEAETLRLALASSSREHGCVDEGGGEVTSQSRAEQLLEEQAHFLQTLIDAVPIPIFYKGVDLKYLGCNKAFAEYNHMPREELIGRSVYDVFPKEEADRHYEEDLQFLKEGEKAVYEFVLTHPDGTTRNVITSKGVLRKPDGTVGGIVGIFIDITDRRKAEQEIEHQGRILDIMTSQMEDMVYYKDKDFRYVFSNKPHCRRVLKCSQGECLGRTDEEIISLGRHERSTGPDKIYGKIDRDTQRAGKPSKFEELTVLDGENTWLEIYITPLHDENREFAGLVGCSRDITERKRMEEDLIKAQKLESIGTLAGGIAHDFNNILTVMLGNITLAKMSIDEDSKAIKRLKDAEKATMRAKDLTQQLLTFAKGGEPFKRVVPINRIIEESANLSLSGSNVKCSYKIGEDLFPVEIDEGQIRQVIHNIVTNAREAMPSGGTVTIKAENVTLARENEFFLPWGHYVRIEIADGGQGIPGAYLPKIFDPYFTTKEMGSQKGTGLGLAICYSIVRKHSGHIKVESAIGAGTTFAIYLPAYEQELAEGGRTDVPLSKYRGKVLLMDDEEMIRDITDEILSALGYEAKFAADGDGAIELYKEAKRSDRPFDVLILDLTIPGGMGGKEAIQRIMDIDPYVKAIVSSGYSNDPVMADFRQYGFSGFISKPFKIEELDEILRKVMAE